MAGRKAKAPELLEQDSHVGKAEIERRKAAAVTLGHGILRMPPEVGANKIAREKWGVLTELYRGVPFVSSADACTIARYCLVHARYMELHRDLYACRKRWDAVALDLAERGEYDAKAALSVFSRMMSETGDIDAKMDRKLSALERMEDRLFLNPLSRVRTVPKGDPVAPPKDELAERGFGAV